MSVETSFNDRKPCFREIGAAASDGSNSILLHSHSHQSPTLPTLCLRFFFFFLSCLPFENHFVCRLVDFVLFCTGRTMYRVEVYVFKKCTLILP